MKKGEKAVIRCASEYAYGEKGAPPNIPANATLNFEVELLSWKSFKDINRKYKGLCLLYIDGNIR